jgi:hypothetical protein
MQPIIPPPGAEPEPNLELLLRAGWSVNSFFGPHCVAFCGQDEVVFRWDSCWHRVAGRGGPAEV